jgi:hypothetical protein
MQRSFVSITLAAALLASPATGKPAQGAGLPAAAGTALSRAHPNYKPESRAIGCEDNWSGWLRRGDVNHDAILDYVVKIRSPTGSGIYGLVSTGRAYTVYKVYPTENPESQGLGAIESGSTGQSTGVAIGECESSGAFFRFTGRGFVLR